MRTSNQQIKRSVNPAHTWPTVLPNLDSSRSLRKACSTPLLPIKSQQECELEERTTTAVQDLIKQIELRGRQSRRGLLTTKEIAASHREADKAFLNSLPSPPTLPSPRTKSRCVRHRPGCEHATDEEGVSPIARQHTWLMQQMEMVARGDGEQDAGDDSGGDGIGRESMLAMTPEWTPAWTSAVKEAYHRPASQPASLTAEEADAGGKDGVQNEPMRPSSQPSRRSRVVRGILIPSLVSGGRAMGGASPAVRDRSEWLRQELDRQISSEPRTHPWQRQSATSAAAATSVDKENVPPTPHSPPPACSGTGAHMQQTAGGHMGAASAARRTALKVAAAAARQQGRRAAESTQASCQTPSYQTPTAAFFKRRGGVGLASLARSIAADCRLSSASKASSGDATPAPLPPRAGVSLDDPADGQERRALDFGSVPISTPISTPTERTPTAHTTTHTAAAETAATAIPGTCGTPPAPTVVPTATATTPAISTPAISTVVTTPAVATNPASTPASMPTAMPAVGTIAVATRSLRAVASMPNMPMRRTTSRVTFDLSPSQPPSQPLPPLPSQPQPPSQPPSQLQTPSQSPPQLPSLTPRPPSEPRTPGRSPRTRPGRWLSTPPSEPPTPYVVPAERDGEEMERATVRTKPAAAGEAVAPQATTRIPPPSTPSEPSGLFQTPAEARCLHVFHRREAMRLFREFQSQHASESGCPVPKFETLLRAYFPQEDGALTPGMAAADSSRRTSPWPLTVA